MTFRVGQKVVCIVSEWVVVERAVPQLCFPPLPTRGNIYTVSGFAPPIKHEPNECWIFLRELPNHISWAARAFRPIVERKTDISIFTRMLTPNSKEKVRA